MEASEEELRKLMVEIRILEGSANTIQSRLRVVNAALEDTMVAMKALESVKDAKKGSELLIPVGAGSLLKVEITDVENTILGVGAGVCIEKSIGSSIQDLKERQEELEKLSNSQKQQLGQLLSNVESSKNRLARMIEESPKT
ncbi:prefoldin subunit alpha [[Eubacterium] cellulosolvens]